VNATNVGSSAQVRIEDTGVGLTEEEIGNVFTKIYRESTLGEGSCFGFRLPFGKPEA
jgi:signal transduction histidine kinase